MDGRKPDSSLRFIKKRDNAQVDSNSNAGENNNGDGDGNGCLRQLDQQIHHRPQQRAENRRNNKHHKAKILRVDIPQKSSSPSTAVVMPAGGISIQQKQGAVSARSNNNSQDGTTSKRRQVEHHHAQHPQQYKQKRNQPYQDQQSSNAFGRRKLLISPSNSQGQSSSVGPIGRPLTAVASRASTTTGTMLWDVESALHMVVQPPQDVSVKEYLSIPSTTSSDGSNSGMTYVTFRVGHAGDASTIANCYRNYLRRCKEDNQPQQRQQLERHEDDVSSSSSSMSSTESTLRERRPLVPAAVETSTTTRNGATSAAAGANTTPDVNDGSTTAAHIENARASSSSASSSSSPSKPTPCWGDESSAGLLELWLADGMGNEDTPPAVFCLLAHISTNCEANETANANEREEKINDGDNPPDTGTSTAELVNTGRRGCSRDEGTSSVAQLKQNHRGDDGVENQKDPRSATGSNETPSSHCNPVNSSYLGAVALFTLAWSNDNSTSDHPTNSVGGDVTSPSSIAVTHSNAGGSAISSGVSGGMSSIHHNTGNGRRTLRVEWLCVNEPIPSNFLGGDKSTNHIATTLEHRLWLRLVVLANITGCELQLANDTLYSRNVHNTGNNDMSAATSNSTNPEHASAATAAGRPKSSTNATRLPPPSAE